LRRLLTRRRRPHEHHPGLGRPPRLQAVVPRSLDVVSVAFILGRAPRREASSPRTRRR
jgi:hypothetical protein